MRKILVAVIVTCCLLLSSCSNEGKYLINTPFYSIEEVGLGEYSYKIFNGDKVYIEKTKTGTEPKIAEVEDADDNVLRLFTAYGTNAFKVQYFDLTNDRTSREFAPWANYTDIWCENGDILIAYVTKTDDTKETIVLIESVFDEKGICFAIERDFATDSLEKLIFLNENEIYLAYETYSSDTGSTEFVNESVIFR